MQLPNQDQFNNPWLPLSTQGLIPDANNPRAEQALAVGAARFHAKHDLLSSSYQEFERPNHNAFCAYGTGFSTDYGRFQIMDTEGCG